MAPMDSSPVIPWAAYTWPGLHLCPTGPDVGSCGAGMWASFPQTL